MKIIEKRVLETDEIVLLISDDSFRGFNVAYIPLDIINVSKERINFEEATFVFPYMVNKNKAKEEYLIHSN